MSERYIFPIVMLVIATLLFAFRRQFAGFKNDIDSEWGGQFMSRRGYETMFGIAAAVLGAASIVALVAAITFR